jgi:predicted RNase H-like nuclease (RuvC/YqgF family)
MATKTMKDLVTQHQERLERLSGLVEQAKKPKKLPVDFVVREKQSLVTRLRQRLEETKGSKQKAIARFDAEIREREKEISALEKQLAEDREQLEKLQKPTRKPRKPAAKQAKAKPSVSSRRKAGAKKPRTKKSS